MKYTRNAYIRAEAVIAERRQRALDERKERLNEISLKAPELYALTRKLNISSCGLVSIVGSGASREETFERIRAIRKEVEERRTALKAGLVSFGYPEDYLDHHFYCKSCEDQGYKEGVRCSCMEELLRRFTSEELNVKCSIQLRDFSEFRADLYSDVPERGVSPRQRMTAVCESCYNYAKNFSANSPSLLFFGQTGLGKTFLSACIAKQLLGEGVNVVFGSFLKLLRQIEDERFNRAEGDTTGALIEAELLILDDVGSEFKNSFTEAVFYEIINERINLGRPTIVSTNLTLKEIGEKYDDRIVSRLTGCFMAMKFIGSDIRQKLRAEKA